MFTTLVESRATRTRRIGSTFVSAALHGALIASAIVLTIPKPGNASTDRQEPPIIYVPVDRPPAQPDLPTTSSRTKPPAGDLMISRPPMPYIDVASPLTSVLVDTHPPIIDDRTVIGRGVDSGSPMGGGVPGALGGGGTWDANQVDRAPAVVGRADEPRYPAQLRAAGVEGRAVIQFVVDTLGRAESGGVTVMETTHPLFAESVREVLPRYRFTPGEAGGHKVRTRVQIPFNFTLTR